MSYLLDTNVCIQYLACPGSLVTARMASMSRKLYFSNTMSGSLVVFLIYKLKTGKFKDGDRLNHRQHKEGPYLQELLSFQIRIC